MPELKHDFSAGKMNKDLDERIVPNGQYRDAMNVQVRTTASDGGEGNAGCLQNLQGNKVIQEYIHYENSWNLLDGNETKFIGSIANEKNNKAYFLIASPNWDNMINIVSNQPDLVVSQKKFIDYIVELNVPNDTTAITCEPVVVDKYGIIDLVDNVVDTSSEFVVVPSPPSQIDGNENEWTKITLKEEYADEIRVGMIMQVYNEGGNPMMQSSYTYSTPSDNPQPEVENIDVGAEVWKVSGSDIWVYTAQDSINWEYVRYVSFKHPERVLEFDNSLIVTGINIIDDLLFWTDNKTEPKKINIKRSKEGTKYNLDQDTWTSQTQLKLTDPLDSDILLDYVDTQYEQSLSPTINNDLKREHVTVIRKAPHMAPTIEMRQTDREGIIEVSGIVKNFANPPQAGELGGIRQQVPIGHEFTLPTVDDIQNGTDNDDTTIPKNPPDLFGGPDNDIDYKINDIIKFKEETPDVNSWLTCVVNGIEWVTGEDGQDYKVITFRVTTINQDLIPTQYINDDDNNPPIPSGSGRWTTELQERDPLFELVFGRFGLRYKYEDNEYSSFGPWSEIAFLPGKFDFDHTKGYNLGMTNTMRKLIIKDFIPHQRVRSADMVAIEILYKNTTSPNVYIVKTITKGIDAEWDNFVINDENPTLAFGEMEITSEMIRRPLPNTQNLRSWDNVPQKALAQEITANRLVFSNYVQGYDILNKPSLKQTLKNYDSPSPDSPQKSMKSIRDYKLGMVFGDKYGRETPVISPGYLEEKYDGRYGKIDGNIRVPKTFSAMKNTLELQQLWGDDPTSPTSGSPDSWISYVKFFIKETSNEYYNLVMDRWYSAEDGNIWLSFASADRNKIDEDTYLILKKEHGTDKPVIESARYKVIAIESNAPEFLKKEETRMGQVSLGAFSEGFVPCGDLTCEDQNWVDYMWDTTVDPLNIAPTKLVTGTEIAIEPGKWNDFLGGWDNSEGDLEVRLKCSTSPNTIAQSNNWRLITYQHTVDNDPEDDAVPNGTAALRWDTPFLADGDLFDQLVIAQGPTPLSDIEWFLDFRKTVTKGKPEFEGKFFVKVEKDPILTSKVLSSNYNQVEYDVSQIFSVAYIDNSEYNPGAMFNEYGGVEGKRQDRRAYKWFNQPGIWHQGGDADSAELTENTESYNAIEIFSMDGTNYDIPVNVDRDDDPLFKIADLEMEGSDSTISNASVWYGWQGHEDFGNWEEYCGNSGTKGCHPYDAEFLGLGCFDSETRFQTGAGTFNAGNPLSGGTDNVAGAVNNVYNRGRETLSFWRWWAAISETIVPAEGGEAYQPGGPYAHGCKIFIDGMRTRQTRFSLYPGTTVPQVTEMVEEYGVPNGNGNYYKQTGFDVGVISTTSETDTFAPTVDGELGRVVFSWLSSNTYAKGGQNEYVPQSSIDSLIGNFPAAPGDPDNGFKTAMTTYGTLFKFLSDPDDNVYQVVSTQGLNTMHMVMSNFSQNPEHVLGGNGPDVDEDEMYDSVGSYWENSPFYESDNITQYGGGYCLQDVADITCVDKDECAATFAFSNHHPIVLENSQSSSPTTFADFGENGQGDQFENFIKIGGVKQGDESIYQMPYWDDFTCLPCARNKFGGNQFAYAENEEGVGRYEGLGEVISENNQVCQEQLDDAWRMGNRFCVRTGIRIEFRRFDQESARLVGGGDRGINTTIWDPRSSICHDGRETMKIAILTPSVFSTATYVPPADPAVWETEPKEDVGLDIYYEASNALPMILNSENSPNFVPYKSKVFRKTWNSNSPGYINKAIDLVPQSMINFITCPPGGYGGPDNPECVGVYGMGLPLESVFEIFGNNPAVMSSGHFVSYIGYTKSNTVIGIKASAGFHTPAPVGAIANFNTISHEQEHMQRGDLFVGDFLVFEHPRTGVKTMSRIEAFMEPIDEDNNVIEPSPVYALAPYEDVQVDNGDGYDYPTITHTSEVRFRETDTSTGFYKINSDVWKFPVELNWHNCWAFGNGVESDRIRDDFNAPQLDNGVKVSATLLDYGKETRGSGMIYSGIYNSTSGKNELNEFNMAQKITKDINPSYGTIQALKTRDTDVVVITEDKTLKVIANKDALYNADGNPQLIATDRVLGQTIPFSGNYGISNNPESLAWDQYRLYFTDKQRGAVLRLSMDGLTPISNVGMRTWFRENLRKSTRALGTFDAISGEYNLTLSIPNGLYSRNNKTLSFNEETKGWVSFKSFIPQTGLSIAGKYITAVSENLADNDRIKKGMWYHYADVLNDNPNLIGFGEVVNANTFYAPYNYLSTAEDVSAWHTPTTVNVLFNEMPEVVKGFRTANYDGSQAKISKEGGLGVYDAAGNLVITPKGNHYQSFGAVNDGEYYNLQRKKGWWVDDIITDLNDESRGGKVEYFKNKEGKWFQKISGGTRSVNSDLNEFSVQGLGYSIPNPLPEDYSPPEQQTTFTIDSDYIDDPTNETD